MIPDKIRVFLFIGMLSLSSFSAATAGRTAAGSALLVSTDALARTNHPSWVILQISRDRASYDRGHIPGARLVLLNQIAMPRDGNDNELPPVEQLKSVFQSVGVSTASHVVLYDDAEGLLAARAYFTLDYLGLGSRAALLDGELARWMADGRPVERSAPQIVPGHIKTIVHYEILIQYSQMREFSLKSKQPGSAVVLVDARSPQQFGYGVPNLRAGVGHIPGAHNVFWIDTLQSPTLPILKSTELIRGMYKNAGVRPGAKVVVYCNSGVQAAHAYFTLKLLGYKPALYDGSFQDWIRHSDAQIE
jgi:thiosulfate/3-mercaptopyruvate sulfurtransferase